ncbi:MAG: hypothetical protein ACTHL8_14400 [Burkholderiaceae bacterium]
MPLRVHRMFRERIQHFQQSLALPGLVRLAGVAAAVALFGVGMCGFLGYFKFKSALEAADRSRMAVPAASVRAGVEAALALGLPLAGVGEAPALLARERSADPEIVAISILDTRGRAVFSTDAAPPGAVRAAPATTATDPGELRMPLRNSFDLQLGEVVVRYVATSSREALARMRGRLVLIVAVGWLGTLLLVAASLAAVGLRAAPRP